MTCFSNHVPCESDLVCPQRRTVYQDDLWPQSKEAGLAWESGGCPDSRLWLGLTALRPPHCLFQRLHREPGIARDHNPGVNLYQHFGNMMQFTRTVQHIHTHLGSTRGTLRRRQRSDVDFIVGVCLRSFTLHYNLVPTGHGCTKERRQLHLKH